jgi:hypothetical protein
MGRQVYTVVDGRAVAVAIKRSAARQFPDDLGAQDSYIRRWVADLLERNLTPLGKPYPASFWRGLGKELKK